MSDRNLISFYETDDGRSITEDVVGRATQQPDWEDSVKVTSRCRGLTFDANAIYGGTEDCVDLNNGASNCRVLAHYYPQGKYVFTVKGGARDNQLTGPIHWAARDVEVELGNWSDQSQERTTGTRLSLRRTDGKPVRVRVLHADKPILDDPSKYQFAFPHPDAWYHGLVVGTMFAWFRATKGIARLFRR